MWFLPPFFFFLKNSEISMSDEVAKNGLPHNFFEKRRKKKKF